MVVLKRMTFSSPRRSRAQKEELEELVADFLTQSPVSVDGYNML
jgi:hypothetical protein